MSTASKFDLVDQSFHEPAPKTDKDRIKLLALADPQGIEQVAAVLDMSQTDAEAFLDRYAPEIEAEATRVLLSGRGIVAQAHRLVHKMLKRIEADLPDMDVSEISDTIKHPLRVIENHTRVQMAEREKKDNLPIFHITIGRSVGDVASARPVDVIDVTPREVGGKL